MIIIAFLVATFLFNRYVVKPILRRWAARTAALQEAELLVADRSGRNAQAKGAAKQKQRPRKARQPRRGRAPPSPPPPPPPPAQNKKQRRDARRAEQAEEVEAERVANMSFEEIMAKRAEDKNKALAEAEAEAEAETKAKAEAEAEAEAGAERASVAASTMSKDKGKGGKKGVKGEKDEDEDEERRMCGNCGTLESPAEPPFKRCEQPTTPSAPRELNHIYSLDHGAPPHRSNNFVRGPPQASAASSCSIARALAIRPHGRHTNVVANRSRLKPQRIRWRSCFVSTPQTP